MLKGITGNRLVNMTPQEMRWFDNMKKAFLKSDQAITNGTFDDDCLEQQFRAIDTAKTLRRSLLGEPVDDQDNKRRFIHFINLEIPTPDRGGLDIELADSRTLKTKRYSFAELVYAIRCMIHENENLNVTEGTDYHILIDWTKPRSGGFGHIESKRFVCNGFILANRLREILAKFVTGIDGLRAFEQGQGFMVTISPPMGSINPTRKTAGFGRAGLASPNS